LKIVTFLPLVFDEWSTSLPVLATPIDVRKGDAISFNEKPCVTIGERVDHGCGAGRRIVVELCVHADIITDSYAPVPAGCRLRFRFFSRSAVHASCQ
jgi:hypothetical protein